jgi:hypothetical protein
MTGAGESASYSLAAVHSDAKFAASFIGAAFQDALKEIKDTLKMCMLYRTRPPTSQAPTAFTYAPPLQPAFPAVTAIVPRAYAPPANGGKTHRDPSPSAGGDFSGRQRLDDAKRGVERLRDGAPFFEVIPSRNRSGNTMVRIGTLIFPATDVNRHAEQNGGCLLSFVIRGSFGSACGNDYDGRRMSLCACPGAAGHGSPSDEFHRQLPGRLVDLAAARAVAPAQGWGNFLPITLPVKLKALFGRPARK